MLRILRRCRARRRDQEPFSPLPQEELLSFACDIASGMRHMSTLKVSLNKHLKIQDGCQFCNFFLFNILSVNHTKYEISNNNMFLVKKKGVFGELSPRNVKYKQQAKL